MSEAVTVDDDDFNSLRRGIACKEHTHAHTHAHTRTHARARSPSQYVGHFANSLSVLARVSVFNLKSDYQELIQTLNLMLTISQLLPHPKHIHVIYYISI